MQKIVSTPYDNARKDRDGPKPSLVVIWQSKYHKEKLKNGYNVVNRRFYKSNLKIISLVIVIIKKP